MKRHAALLLISILGVLVGTVACEEDSTTGLASVTCTDGTASCGEGATARCVNVRVDSSNCGTCGRTCSTGQTCTSGECAAPSSGNPDPPGGGAPDSGLPDAGGGNNGECKASPARCEVDAECCSGRCSPSADGDIKSCRPT
jgi:hypothetical protein